MFVSVSARMPECSPTLIWLTITVSNVAPNLASAELNVSPFSRCRRIDSSMSRCFSSAFSSASVPSALGNDTPLSVSVARFRRMKIRSLFFSLSFAPLLGLPNRHHELASVPAEDERGRTAVEPTAIVPALANVDLRARRMLLR